MIIIDKNAKREVQVKYPDRTRVLFPNLDDGYISSNDIVVPGINAPISDDGVSVATINDGAEGGAISKLVIGIEPVQDLHGQDNPYPAGGGKNLLNPAVAFDASAYYTVNNDGTVTVTASDGRAWTILTEVQLPAGTYTLSANGAGISSVRLSTEGYETDHLFNSSEGYTFTFAEQGAIKIKLSYSGVTYPKTEKVMLESGSAVTSWSPYSNICPINGWTQAKVIRTGKNLCPLATMNTVNGGYINSSTGNVGTVKSGKTYTISVTNKSASTANLIVRMMVNGSWVEQGYGNLVANGRKSITFTATNDGDISLSAHVDTDYSPLFTHIQLELGSTATTYEPYTATTYTIDLNGTRYGGTLDVSTGVLTVDKFGFDATSSLSYAPQSQGTNCNVFNINITANNFPVPVSNTAISNRFSRNIASDTPGRMVHNNEVIYFVVSKSEEEYSENGIKAWLDEHPTQFVYELATPTTVQLTAQEVTTLLGQNNIWADCGNVLELSYSANMNIRLQDLLNEKLDKPTIPGTLGQVLTSDGEGGQTWETPE